MQISRTIVKRRMSPGASEKEVTQMVNKVIALAAAREVIFDNASSNDGRMFARRILKKAEGTEAFRIYRAIIKEQEVSDDD